MGFEGRELGGFLGRRGAEKRREKREEERENRCQLLSQNTAYGNLFLCLLGSLKRYCKGSYGNAASLI